MTNLSIHRQAGAAAALVVFGSTAPRTSGMPGIGVFLRDGGFVAVPPLGGNLRRERQESDIGP